LNLLLRLGDCAHRMTAIEEGSVERILCDPPYGLEFMGKKWDRLDGVGTGGTSSPSILKAQVRKPGCSEVPVSPIALLLRWGMLGS